MMTSKYILKTQSGVSIFLGKAVMSINSIMKETNIILFLGKTTVLVANAER